MLKESNKALSLYMNKILLKIVGNHDLVDVLNIDVDDTAELKKSPPTPPASQPRARRSTISTCRNSKDQEKGWTKALKRMTVMGWSSSSHSNTNSVSSINADSATSNKSSSAFKTYHRRNAEDGSNLSNSALVE